MGVTIREQIQAPPDKVFAMATDFARAAEVIRGIQRIEMLTEGPVGVGTRFRETRVMFKREATEEMELVAFEPPRRYALACESHGCRYDTQVTLTPSGSGTDIEMRFEATPLTLFARVMSFLMKPMLRSVTKAIAADLDDLKKAVEESVTAAT